MWIAASIVLGLIGAETAPPPPELPVAILAWECSGEIAPGAEWTGAKIDLNDERVRFVEVVVRFDDAALPADQARWFESPTAAPVTTFLAWEQFCRDACRDDVLGALFPDGTSPLVERTSGGRHCRERAHVDTDGTRTSRVALEVVAMHFQAGQSGLVVNPTVDPGSATCADDRYAGRTPEVSVWVDERHDLDRGTVEWRGGSGDRAANDAEPEIQEAAGILLDRMLDLLGARRPEPGTLRTGRAAMRLAAYEMRDLGALCTSPTDRSAGEPHELPGEVSFGAAVLPPDEMRAMAAIEARYGRDDSEAEVALRLLGDTPSPRERDTILELLGASIEAQHTVAASLALRALLAADPEEARRRARPLLEHDELWRSACGVFVLSDPVLARRFADRDTITPAVRNEIIEYLAADDEPFSSTSNEKLEEMGVAFRETCSRVLSRFRSTSRPLPTDTRSGWPPRARRFLYIPRHRESRSIVLGRYRRVPRTGCAGSRIRYTASLIRSFTRNHASA